MTDTDCKHPSFSFAPPIEVAWYNEDDIEGDITVEVECNECGEKFMAYYDFYSVSGV